VRIIAGQYRGRVLKSPPSMQIRPTSDRLRETLFNVIAPRIEGVRFLDLCAGSGAVGIEAISRGASFVTFVDRSRKMCGLVEANLDLCGVPEEMTEVVLSEAADYLRRLTTSPSSTLPTRSTICRSSNSSAHTPRRCSATAASSSSNIITKII
jgi:16S rRNA (guanine966-N2)-methyltransferase